MEKHSIREKLRQLDALDTINMEDVENCSDLAWVVAMKKQCDCGAEMRSECRCRRTLEYKETAERLRSKKFGEKWDKSLQNITHLHRQSIPAQDNL